MGVTHLHPPPLPAHSLRLQATPIDTEDFQPLSPALPNPFLLPLVQFSLDMEDFNPSTLPYLTEVVMGKATGKASTRRVAGVGGDFPQVPPSLVGGWG